MLSILDAAINVNVMIILYPLFVEEFVDEAGDVHHFRHNSESLAEALKAYYKHCVSLIIY